MDNIISPPVVQATPVHRRRLGDMIVTTLSDGYVPSSFSRLRNIEPDQALELFRLGARQMPPRSPVNAFAVHHQGRLALIDTGAGSSMGPTLGKLPVGLEAAGIDPRDVDTVLLTHIHPDHSNGLTSVEGQRLFPNARIRAHQRDLAHWWDDREMAKASPQDHEDLFLAPRRQLDAYEGMVEPFDEDEVFPGIRSLPLPGHTPGHSGFLLSCGGENLLIWGDAVHYQEIQPVMLDVAHLYDVDPVMAAQSRRQALAKASEHDWLVAGMHMHFPALGRVRPEGDAYRILPEPWTCELAR